MGRIVFDSSGSSLPAAIKSIQRVNTHTNGVTTITAVDLDKTIVTTTAYGSVGKVPVYLSSATTLQRYQQGGGTSGIGVDSRVEIIEYK